MSKILIVVDMQNDFCLESGSLYVKGATPALWNIEELMYKEHFDRVWFTVDWHAFFHPSFKENDPELIKNLVDFVGNIRFCGVSDLVNDLFNEIEELTERYSVEAISFLSKELDSRGYFVD